MSWWGSHEVKYFFSETRMFFTSNSGLENRAYVHSTVPFYPPSPSTSASYVNFFFYNGLPLDSPDSPISNAPRHPAWIVQNQQAIVVRHPALRRSIETSASPYLGPIRGSGTHSVIVAA